MTPPAGGNPPALPTRLPGTTIAPPAGAWTRLKRLARRDIVEFAQGSWIRVATKFVPAAFLAWAVYGMARPAFDPSTSYDPIFWAVGGGCLLTLYGRFHTRDIDVDDDDLDEPLEDKWRFSIPHLFRKGPRT